MRNILYLSRLIKQIQEQVRSCFLNPQKSSKQQQTTTTTKPPFFFTPTNLSASKKYSFLNTQTPETLFVFSFFSLKTKPEKPNPKKTQTPENPKTQNPKKPKNQKPKTSKTRNPFFSLEKKHRRPLQGIEPQSPTTPRRWRLAVFFRRKFFWAPVVSGQKKGPDISLWAFGLGSFSFSFFCFF